MEKKMTQFICITQTSQMAGFSGPTGTVYQSYFNQPFNVNEKVDIEFFENNKRFQKVGVLEKIGIKKSPTLDTQHVKSNDIEHFLKDIKGITKASIEKIVSTYESVEFLREEIELGGDLSNLQIPKKQVFLIKQKIIGE